MARIGKSRGNASRFFPFLGILGGSALVADGTAVSAELGNAIGWVEKGEAMGVAAGSVRFWRAAAVCGAKWMRLLRGAKPVG